MDFYHNLLDFLMKNSHDFSSFLNGNSKINQHQIRLLELIMVSLFLIIYFMYFTKNRLAHSKIIHYAIRLINKYKILIF